MNRYSIRADAWNWTVYEHGVTGEKSKRPGEPTEAPVAYCKNLETAAEFIYTIEARRKTEMLGLVAAFNAGRDAAIAAVREYAKGKP